MSCAKTAELIEMPFRLWTSVGSSKHNYIRWGHRSHHMNGQFEGVEGAAHCKMQQLSAVSCEKMAVLIEMPFGIWTRVGPRKHVLDESAY